MLVRDGVFVSKLKALAWPILLGLIALAATLDIAHAAPAGTVDFSAPSAIIELRDKLTPYRAPSGPEADGSSWYMLTAVNNSVRPATRVFLAGQPGDAIMRPWPLPARPTILQAAASDPQVIVEEARAHGRHAYRVTIPPATTVTLAVRIIYADTPPSVLAWTEPALVSHNRQLAVFVAAVAGMIAAAMAIMLGLAVMTGHPAPFWASLLLVLIFCLRLAVTGTLDAGWATHIGGPFGLEVALAGLALTVGLRLADFVVPVETLWPRGRPWFSRVLILLTIISLLAFLGVVGAMVAVDVLIVLGTTAVTLYFVQCGRLGNQAARVAAPSAAVFALVTAGAAAVSFGAFADSQTASAIVGGFLAAGAVLLALAVAAGEGIAILPASRYGMTRDDALAMPIPHPPGLEPIPSTPSDLLAIAASHQGVFELDFVADTVRLSREAAALIGHPGNAVALSHASWVERIHPDDRATYREAIHDYQSHAGIAFRIEFRAQSDSGRYPWFEIRATMLGEGAKAERCLGLLADVTARKEADAALSERNARDPLTGLGNRVALMEGLERLGPRLSAIHFALLDMDRFKAVHMSLGDAGGDAVLAGVAQRLVRRFGKSADVYRVSGDTFALVFREAGLSPTAIGADLVEACAAPFEQHDRNVFVTASVGVAAGEDARDPFELLKNAELALLQAKRQGGACARSYTPALEATAPGDAVALEADLRQALKDKQLDVYYQPIMRLSDGSLAGFEALMRWHHPQKGVIEPSSFVAHCEETGLIVAIGRLALERAAEDLSQWQRFFPLDPPLFASVNLSRRQLLDVGFEGVLESVLASHKLKPGTLKLEVTESAVANGSDTRQILTRLRAAGASLAIDDFGTGVSNFNQLKDIPFDTVKLDRSFLGRHGGTHDDADGAVILGSIVNLAHDLERDVVIEGVETEDEADWLRGLGCEYGQGFYFSAPLPRTEALAFIAKHYKVETGQA
jgi:diguanylate cyclase (GGDEF)-like protein